MATAFSLSRALSRALSRTGLALGGAAALLLAACSEPEVILPGPREDIRPDDAAAAAEPLPGSRPIRLPAQSVNREWPQSFGSPRYRVAHPALSPQPQLLWKVGIGAGDSKRQRITAEPVVGGGLIYTLDAGARVSGVTPGGTVAWSTDLVPPSDRDGSATGGGLAYADGVLYVSSGFGRLTALDAASGRILWQQRLEATGSGMPTVHDGLIYLVAGDDTGWAIRTRDGRVAWRITATPSVANVLGAPAPAVSGQFAVFGFGSGDVVGVFRRGGIRRWSGTVAGRRVGHAVSRIGDVTGSPVIVGNRVYAANQSGRTAAFELETGDRLWTLREGAVDPLWPAGGSLFAISDRNQLLRIDAAEGRVIWAADLPGFVKDKPRKRGRVHAHYGPVLAGGRVIVASDDGLLRFFSPEDGQLTATVEVPGGATTAPVVADRTLYVVSTRGDLLAFR